MRLREAKTNQLPFGGLLSVFSGDFLQLPPLRRLSLATPMDEAGCYRDTTGDEEVDLDQPELEQADTDARLGITLWQDIRTVVSLQTNIRAPGVLSRFLLEMREGKISDAMWDLYLSRVMQRDDPRMKQPPFSSSHPRYLVHRHSIRHRQTFANAAAHCKANRVPLFVVQAADVVRAEDEKHFTTDVRTQVLSLADPRDTQSLPGLLPLYVHIISRLS